MRLTTAIFLALLALLTVVALATASYYRWEKSKAKELETIKTFSADLRTNLQFTMFAATKLVDGEFFLRASTDAFPRYLSDPRLSYRNMEKAIVLNFVDKDGFRVFSKTIPMRIFSTNVDGEGKQIGLNFEGHDSMSTKVYESIDKLTVQWTLDTTIPPDTVGSIASVATVPPKPAAVATETDDTDGPMLDHCAPGITKEERLKRLAKHGSVREVGSGIYSVGLKRIHFFTGDNSLLSCQ